MRGTSPSLRSGPWGELQEWDLRLEQPLEYVAFEKTQRGDPSWNFGSMNPPSLAALLGSMGCSESLVKRLLDAKSQDSAGNLILNPDEPLLLAISPEIRAKLYKFLSGNPINRLQANPYFIPEGDVFRLFSDESPRVLEVMKKAGVIRLLQKLSYKNNGFTYFSDPEVVLKHLNSENERLDFLQSLTSMSVVNMRLLVRPQSDVDKIVNYWSLSIPLVPAKDLRPLLESCQRLPEGGTASILYLLPPLARERLFTSLTPVNDAGAAKLPDCHWTALNFFNSRTDDRMSDNDYASRWIGEHYYQIGRPSLPGDLVLLINKEERVVHSAVYLADDVVFTKNGINFAQPWVLMHQNHMIGHFSGVNPVTVAYFRKRDR